MKVKSIITICIILAVCTVLGVMVYLFYPAMIATINGNKYYTHKQYEENYQKGFDNGVKNFEELTAQIDNYKDMINELQDENQSLKKENAMYKNFVDNYDKEGVSVVTFEVDSTLYDILPVDNGVILSNVLTAFEAPEKEGYNLVGWSLDGQTVVDPAVYKVTGNITLKALYEIKVYSVKFVLGLTNGEENTVFYQTTITHGQMITNDMLLLADASALEYKNAEQTSMKYSSVSWSTEGYSGQPIYDDNGNCIGQTASIDFEEYSVIKDTTFYVYGWGTKITDLPELPG